VNHTTGVSFPFYPIPDEAISQPHWIEGGEAGNVDLRSSADRHLLIVDKDRRYLYELYNVFFDGVQWHAGSGAFFDLNSNARRPDGWTSADAAGLAILPGLVRYDEVFGPNEIGHAFRVTVRNTNGYVYPASHRAGSTAGALPMGARLRLKATKDLTPFKPEVQKIFRAMQRYGLIVADNGSDMYISGTYDTRWNNDVLNPAFGALTASDFEVIKLGYQPPPGRASLADDFDGDAKADLALFRPATSEWFVRQSSSGYSFSNYLDVPWGLPGDIPVSGDFDGDGKTDLTVYRPSEGNWYIRYSSTAFSTWTKISWGLPGDTPLAADFDGDGKTDLVVYRPATSTWYVLFSSNNYSYSTWTSYQWGLAGDLPITGDFDGDGKTDLIVYRPQEGNWYVRYSSAGYGYTGWTSYQWGLPGDVPIAADFDGDGKTDLVVYRPQEATWYVRFSSKGYGYTGWTSYQWGLPGDLPAPNDFDGDGITDLVVYRPQNGTWYVKFSASNFSSWTSYQWGLATDTPLFKN
jgi:hypothetical protein